MSMGDKRLDAVVDAICGRGCKYVNTILANETARAQCPELHDLSEPHRARVLQELAAVMSVYNQSGNCTIATPGSSLNLPF